MREDDILKLLHSWGQEHLANGLDTLSLKQMESFYKKLTLYGKKTLDKQREFLVEKTSASLSSASSPAYKETNQKRHRLGRKAIEEGKAACVVLAGGQGTRMGIAGPKGKVAVSPIMNKTLFQMICEKTLALSSQCSRPLQIAFLASSKNYSETIEYFKEKKWFGLQEAQVKILCQEDLPFLSETGNWELETSGQLAEGPNGNGKVFHYLYETGLFDVWKDSGIEYINVIQVDNPLADPFDADLIGELAEGDCDIALKAVERESAEENVGIVASFTEGIRIVEYSDLSLKERSALDEKGGLRLPFANIGLMAFSMKFAHDCRDKISSMPWHLAFKKTDIFNERGYEAKEMWKFEYFIFDLLSFASKISLIKAVREDCYAPLKNAVGDKSHSTVKHALLQKYKKIYSDLSGIAAPQRDFELDCAFFYPTDEMKSYWKKRPLPPKDYIEPELL